MVGERDQEGLMVKAVLKGAGPRPSAEPIQGRYDRATLAELVSADDRRDSGVVRETRESGQRLLARSMSRASF